MDKKVEKSFSFLSAQKETESKDLEYKSKEFNKFVREPEENGFFMKATELGKYSTAEKSKNF